MSGSPVKRARRAAQAAIAGNATNGHGAGASVPQFGARLPVWPTPPLGVPHAPRLPVTAARFATAAAMPPPAHVAAESSPAGDVASAHAAPTAMPAPPSASPPASNGQPFVAPSSGPPAPARPWVDAQAEDATRWRRMAAERDHAAGVGAGLQADMLLTSQWLYVVKQRRIPATSCQILMRCTEPAPMYDLIVPGEAVVTTQSGQDNPAIALLEYMARNRARRGSHEYFRGRIQGATTHGIEDLGGGDMSFAPEAPTAATPAAPGAQWTPHAAMGAAASPWGAPPGAPPGYFGAPPPGWGPGPMPYPLMGWPPPMQIPQPPPPSAGAEQLEFWKLQVNAQAAQQASWQQMWMTMMGHMQQPAAAPAPDAGWGMFDKMLGAAERIADMRRPEAAPAAVPPIQVVRVDEDTTLVAQDGKVDTTLTGALMVKDGLKGVASMLKSRMGAQNAAAINAGAHGPKPKAPPAGGK